MTDFDVDAKYDEIMGENPNAERPMTAEPEVQAESQAQPQPEVQSQPQTAQELAFKWKDKEIKVPFGDPRLAKWAAQGYDYAQQMEAYNKERQGWESKVKDYDQRFGTIDKWARENPDKWNLLLQKYQEAQATGTEQALKLPPEVQQKLEALDKIVPVVEQIQQEKIQAQQASEDKELDTEIKSIRESHPDLDWKSVDEMGNSALELAILKYANERGIKNFTDAFYAYAHKDLLSRAKEGAKETVAKDIQKKTKQGLLGTTRAPTKGLAPAQNVKSKSYDDIYREALSELGIAH